MNFKILLFLLLSICSLINVKGQDRKNLDSLWNAFTQAKHDTTRVMLLNENIGYMYENYSTDSAIMYYKQAIEIADQALGSAFTPAKTKYRFLFLKSASLRYIGIVLKNQGKYEKALDYYFSSIKISEELYSDNHNDIKNKIGMSASYNNIGNVYKEQGSYEKAIDYYQKSLEISEELNDKNGISNCYTNIGVVYSDYCNYDKSIEYYLKSLKIREELLIENPNDYRTKNVISTCLNNIGVVHQNQGSYEKSIDYFMKALKIKEELQDKKGKSACYINIGLVYWSKGSYDKAIDYYLKSLKISEELLDKKGISYCYTNIGVIYHHQGSYDMAIDYHEKSLKICKEINDKNGISACYTNIGAVYKNNGNYNKAIDYYLKSLKIKEELHDNKGMSACYSNIGLVHADQGNYDEAIDYYLKSLKIKEEFLDKNGIAMVYSNISGLYIKLSNTFADLNKRERVAHLENALLYGNKAYELAYEIGAVPTQNNVAVHLQEAYTKLGRFKQAIKYAEIFIETQDIMFSEEKTKALTEITTRYETEKKQLQIEKMEAQKQLDDKKIEAQQAENHKQQVIIFSAIGGLLTVLVFSIIILSMFRQKRKANILLALQNEEIKQQKEEIESQRDEITEQRDKVQIQKEQIEQLYDVAIERKNIVEAQKQEIEDSILYAKRIQNAVLPADKYADSILGEHFIVFRPKDVVSGDFYWATKTEEWTVVTVADCTGHGVPGAFMSMLGISFLNEIVRKKDVTNAGEVLNHLRISIIDALKQTGESGSQKDGMDMSIVAIHKTKKRLVFAGANNPLWIIRQGAQSQSFEDKADIVQAIKADSMPVAVYLRMDDFTNHEIELNKGDQIYMFSDGFPDQFGGSKGKKFMYKKFKRLIAETSALTMKQQGETIEKELDKWMNGNVEKYKQIDDITVLGIKI